MKKTVALFFIMVLCSSSLLAQQATGDPWIKKIYNDTWGRDPEPFEYNIKNYNGGHWNSYTDLMKAVYEWRKNQASLGITYKYSQKIVNNNILLGVYQNGIQVAANIISTNGGGIVAQGGGNIISTNGSGIVAQGGGNIVAQGGGNIVVNSDTRGLGFPNGRVVQSAGTIVIPTSGGGVMIIK